MEIKKILLILALLSTNLGLIKAQEDKPREKEELAKEDSEKKPDIISTINDDVKMLISQALVDEGSLKDLLSYFSINKEFNELVKYEHLENFIINYINSLNIDQQKEAFKDIIEALKSEPRHVQIALYITKKLCDRGIIEKLVNNILASETVAQDILDYFPIDKEVNKLIKNNNLYDCLQKNIDEYIKKNKNNLFKMAAETGHKDIVELLLTEEGIPAKDKVFALVYAAKTGHKDVVELLSKEKDIPLIDKGYALRYAAEYGHDDVVGLLLKEEDMPTMGKGAALVYASMNGHKSIVELLLKEKDIIPKDKGAALVYAAMSGHKRIVELLLEEKDIPPKDKGAALIHAAKKGHKDIVELLLKEKDIILKDKGLALKEAAKGGHKDIVELLLKEENIMPEYKGEALIEAACNGYKNIVKLLLQEDISSTDKSSAFKCAKNHAKWDFSNRSVYESIAELIEDSMGFKDQVVNLFNIN